MAKPQEKCQPVDSDAIAAVLNDFLSWNEEIGAGGLAGLESLFLWAKGGREQPYAMAFEAGRVLRGKPRTKPVEIPCEKPDLRGA